VKKLTERNAGISSDDDMIDITTSGTMTERTLNQRSPINLPGNIIMYLCLTQDHSRFILRGCSRVRFF